MSNVHRVLCAVDIDDAASTAVGQGIAIARARGGKLLLVCAVSPREPFSHRAADRIAYLLRARRSAEAAGVEVRADVQTGETAEIIDLHARARQADLIVVSVEHGRGVGQQWGAVAEQILRTAPCPTLVVPAGAANQGVFRNIVYAAQLSSDRLRMEHAQALSDPRERRVTVLHVVDGAADGPAALQRLQTALSGCGQDAGLARVAVGSAASEILKTTRSVNADLLVIEARARTRIGRRLFGVTGTLLRGAGCPVLAIPIEARGALADMPAA